MPYTSYKYRIFGGNKLPDSGSDFHGTRCAISQKPFYDYYGTIFFPVALNYEWSIALA